MSRGNSKPGTALSAMCWWSTGVDGMKPPTIAATWGAQIPAAFTTSSVSMGPAIADHASDLTSGRQLEPRDADALPDPDTQRASGIRDRVRRAVRVQVPVAGQMDSAVQGLRGDRRHERAGLLRPDDLGVETDPASSAGSPLQLAELCGARREAQAADPLENAQPFVQLDAVATEPPSSSRMG